MKKKSLLFIFVLGGLMSCQNDFISETGNESTLQEGNRITIIGDSSKVMSRGNVQFTGGTATGAGLYHASERPPVEAIPNPGYEIDYFFGGPVNGDRHTYDFAKSQESLFKVNMEPGDNIFEVKFKPVMRNVKITAGNGGSVTPSGETQYQVSVPHQISATANNGYAFSHWTATSGINIIESSFSNTTFVLDANSSGGTITANFKRNGPKEIMINTYYSMKEAKVTASPSVPCNVKVKARFEFTFYHGPSNYVDLEFRLRAGEPMSDPIDLEKYTGQKIQSINRSSILEVSPTSYTDPSGNKYIIKF